MQPKPRNARNCQALSPRARRRAPASRDLRPKFRMLRSPIGLRGPWPLLLLGGLACTFGAVIQRVTGPDESEITHASVGGGVNVYLTGSALGTPFNPRARPPLMPPSCPICPLSVS